MSRSSMVLCRGFQTAACLWVCWAHAGQADEVRWLGRNGQWHVAENWSTNPDLPGLGDDVVIEAGSEWDRYTVTHSQGNNSMKSLTTHELVELTGGTFQVQETLVFGPKAMHRNKLPNL